LRIRADDPAAPIEIMFSDAIFVNIGQQLGSHEHAFTMDVVDGNRGRRCGLWWKTNLIAGGFGRRRLNVWHVWKARH
jgi:hypothetical protein